MATRSILITGCSSGIGECCARGLKQRGWRVFATARKPEDLDRLQAEGLEAVHLEMADSASVESCVRQVLDATGGTLEALFTNAAYGQPGAIEDLSLDVLRAQFDSNFFGHHDLVRRVIPAMRAQGHGRIVFNSSILGLVAMKYRGAYNASKFALEGYADTLRMELKSAGIRVATIAPGPIFSRFAEHALAAFHRNVDIEASPHREEYRAQERRMKGERHSRFKLPPQAVLDKLVHALESPNPRPQYLVTTATHIAAFGKRILPKRLADLALERMS